MARKTATASKPETTPGKKKLLKKRFDLPVKGRLGQTVRMPKWLKAIGAYFVGSWQELREVSWPTRRATWGLTTAVIMFTLLMAIFVLALDYGFEQLFKRLILRG